MSKKKLTEIMPNLEQYVKVKNPIDYQNKTLIVMGQAELKYYRKNSGEMKKAEVGAEFIRKEFIRFLVENDLVEDDRA